MVYREAFSTSHRRVNNIFEDDGTVIESPISLTTYIIEIWSEYDLIVGGNRERCREEDVEDYKLEIGVSELISTTVHLILSRNLHEF